MKNSWLSRAHRACSTVDMDIFLQSVNFSTRVDPNQAQIEALAQALGLVRISESSTVFRIEHAAHYLMPRPISVSLAPLDKNHEF
jgi:hypothetical protein